MQRVRGQHHNNKENKTMPQCANKRIDPMPSSILTILPNFFF